RTADRRLRHRAVAAGATRSLVPPSPCAVVIFGASGDLTKRKLLPALYNLKAAGLLPSQFAMVGVARGAQSHEEVRDEQTKAIREFATRPVEDRLWSDLRGALNYEAGEFGDPDTYRRLSSLLADVAQTHGTGGNVLFYLAVPPDFFAEIVWHLAQVGLVKE